MRSCESQGKVSRFGHNVLTGQRPSRIRGVLHLTAARDRGHQRQQGNQRILHAGSQEPVGAVSLSSDPYPVIFDIANCNGLRVI